MEAPELGALTLLGILLVIVGVILILIPLIARIGLRLEEVHPLLLVWKKVDGFYVGTSPLLLIILAALYILFLIRR